MKATVYPEAEEISVSGPDAFYIYCALTLFDNAALGPQIKEALWDHFDQSNDMDHWKKTVSTSNYKNGAFPPLEILATLAVRVYPLDIRIYSPKYADGHRDYTVDNVSFGGHVKRGMTLRAGEHGELGLVVKHNSKTGKNRIPATVINVLSPAPGSVDNQRLAKDSVTASPFSLAVYDSDTRTHMPIGARFIPPPSQQQQSQQPQSNSSRLSLHRNQMAEFAGSGGGGGGGCKAHYMNFDLGLSKIKPSWQFILKGCKDVPVFVFAMRTKDGVRHASYIAHWPVDMVEPQITISSRHGDDGLIVIPLESNNLEEAKRHVVSELKCIIDP